MIRALRVAVTVALVVPNLALAQVPRTGTAAPPGGAPDGVFTPAPVPAAGTNPGVVGPSGGPGSIPDQVAPSGQAAGPNNSTPYSTTGSGQQPPDVASPHNGNENGGVRAVTPNLSP